MSLRSLAFGRTPGPLGAVNDEDKSMKMDETRLLMRHYGRRAVGLSLQDNKWQKKTEATTMIGGRSGSVCRVLLVGRRKRGSHADLLLSATEKKKGNR